MVGTCATSGDGLYEALDWIVDSLKGRRDGGIVDGGSPPGGGDGGSGEGGKERDEAALSPAEQEAKRMEALLMEWLEREDDEDDVFLQKLEGEGSSPQSFHRRKHDHHSCARARSLPLSLLARTALQTRRWMCGITARTCASRGCY